MKKTQLPLLLTVAAGLASLLAPISARAVTFPLYVSNNSGTFGNTVMQFTSGGADSTFASSGLSGPEGLAFDSAGNLYVANVNGSTIEKFSPTGVHLGVFANVPNPVGLAFDTAGNLYVASFTNNKIQKFSSAGVDLGIFSTSGLSQPTGLAFDAAGTTLYAANNNGGTFGSGTIVKFTLAGGASTLFASSLDGPFGLAFDTGGNIYVANDLSNVIQKFTPLGVGTIFANTGLSTPVGLAFDSAGNLYAANQGSNTVEKFSSTGTDLGPFASSGLSSPTFIAFQQDVPEPSTWVMLGIPALLAAARRQRKSHNIAPKISPRPAANSTLNTSSPNLTDLRPTGKPSASSRPSPANGLIHAPIRLSNHRATYLPHFLFDYNYHRPHSALNSLRSRNGSAFWQHRWQRCDSFRWRRPGEYVGRAGVKLIPADEEPPTPPHRSRLLFPPLSRIATSATNVLTINS